MPVKDSKTKEKKSQLKVAVVEKETKIVAKKPAVKSKKAGSLSIPVYNLAGKEDGTLDLPQDIFGAKVNSKLLAQAARVYIANQKVQPGSTKTRGEVNLTTKKWFRQKGTGRARHGAQSAPIFVGGGVAMGPKPRKVRLDLPKKMKKVALVSALSVRTEANLIFGLSGLDKSAGKTKEFATLIGKLATKENKGIKRTLIITADTNDNVLRAVKNLKKVNALSIDNLNAYEIIRHEVLAITKEAVDKLAKKVNGGDA